jgi:hypothetical protein
MLTLQQHMHAPMNELLSIQGARALSLCVCARLFFDFNRTSCYAYHETYLADALFQVQIRVWDRSDRS